MYGVFVHKKAGESRAVTAVSLLCKVPQGCPVLSKLEHKYDVLMLKLTEMNKEPEKSLKATTVSCL